MRILFSYVTFRGLFLWSLLLFLTVSCEKEDPYEDDTVSPQIRLVNEWIKENMEALYLWNNFIPLGLNPGQEPNPEAFFDTMVYKPEDKWSYITDDFPALLAELQGTPLSTGISPAFVNVGSGQIVMIVEFVYPGSPADNAGLERGDMIVAIDGQTMNLDNYFQLFSRNSFVAGFGMISGNDIVPTGETVSITSQIIETDPVIHYDIIEINGIKTGYLVYSTFISGEGDKFLNSLDVIFDEFKSSGISELIVDLRYNRGGFINVAGYLASAIAPASVVSSRPVLVKYEYNADLNKYLTDKYGAGSQQLVFKFPVNTHNINFSKIYFLTGWKTASASELVIIGLEPYMNVVTIGERTTGKYTGSWVLSDDNKPPKHKWGMLPIVLKYANSQGFTDFKNGLNPDFLVDENIFDLKPFGDDGDPLLSKAKELIGGLVVMAPKKVMPVITATRIEGKELRDRKILIIEE